MFFKEFEANTIYENTFERLYNSRFYICNFLLVLFKIDIIEFQNYRGVFQKKTLFFSSPFLIITCVYTHTVYFNIINSGVYVNRLKFIIRVTLKCCCVLYEMCFFFCSNLDVDTIHTFLYMVIRSPYTYALCGNTHIIKQIKMNTFSLFQS